MARATVRVGTGYDIEGNFGNNIENILTSQVQHVKVSHLIFVMDVSLLNLKIKEHMWASVVDVLPSAAVNQAAT